MPPLYRLLRRAQSEAHPLGMDKMKFKITSLILGFIIISGTTPLFADNETQPESNTLLGTWQIHYVTTSLTISIEADKTAVVYWDWNGSSSCYRTKWIEKKNGLLIEGFPRFRFWKTDNINRPVMQMEPIDPKLTTEEMAKFPIKHVMIKIEMDDKWLGQMTNRPLPKGWESESPVEKPDKKFLTRGWTLP